MIFYSDIEKAHASCTFILLGFGLVADELLGSEKKFLIPIEKHLWTSVSTPVIFKVSSPGSAMGNYKGQKTRKGSKI